MTLGRLGRPRVNLAHHLNQGRVAWWLGIPGYFSQGRKWIDLMGRFHLEPAITGAIDYARAGPGPTTFANSFRSLGNGGLSSYYRTLAGFTYPTAAITLACWFKHEALGFSALMGNHKSAGFAGPLLSCDNQNTPEAFLQTSVSAYHLASSPSRPAFNTWHHYAMTYDGATFQTYLDGQPDLSTAATGTITPGYLNNFYLGIDDTNGVGDQAAGLSADLGVWSRALTPEEIRRLVTLTYRNYAGMLLPPVGSSLSVDIPTAGVLPTIPDAVLLETAAGDLLLESAGRLLLQTVTNLYVSSYMPPIENLRALREGFALRGRRVPPGPGGAESVVATFAVEPIGLDKFHVPLAIARPRARSLVPTLPVATLGDTPRPDAPDPALGVAPIWHVPMTKAVPRARPANLDIAHGNPGDTPRSETIGLDKFHTPVHRVIVPRKSPTISPDSAILQSSLFPPDPVAFSMPPWHVAMALPARAVRTRGRHEFYPDGAVLLGVPGQVLETILLQFHTPLGLVHAKFFVRRTPPLPIGGIDLEPGQRVERVFEDALGPLPPPPWPHRKRSPFWSATLANDLTVLFEAPHPDALQPPTEQVRLLRRALRHAFDIDQAAVVYPLNFSTPLIPRIRRWMLAAGLWRARY